MATFNSDLITVGQGSKSVVPGTVCPVFGRIAIAASTTLSQVAPDTMPVCYAPGPSSHLLGGWFTLPILDSSNTLRMSFGDGTNLIIASATITTWNAAQRQNLEDITPGAVVTPLMGSAVTYTTDTLLRWTVTTTSGAATAASVLYIYFVLYFGQD